MDSISSRFVDKLFSLSECNTIPRHVFNKAKSCLIDYIGVVFAGSYFYKDIINNYIYKNELGGNIHIFNWNNTVNFHDAILVNAFNSHVLELDDSHRVALTHLGASIFSALIGVAEKRSCTINQLLIGAIVGYEAAIRIGNCIQPSHKKRGFHSSGTCCTIGCAMGISAMLGYKKDEFFNAFSASVTSSAGLLEIIGGESEQKPYNVANAAVAGVNAALFGKYFHAPEDILEGKSGFLKAVSDTYQPERLFDDGFAIETIYQKLYASCRHCHTPMEATMLIRNETQRPYHDIVDILVETYDLAILRHDHTIINGISSAKQSIPYSVAASYFFGNGGLGVYSKDSICNEDILTLTKKVKLKENRELSQLVPKKRASIVTITYSDGYKCSKRVDFAKGEPENPLTQRELYEKYKTLMLMSGKDFQQLEKILDLINQMDSYVKDIFDI